MTHQNPHAAVSVREAVPDGCERLLSITPVSAMTSLSQSTIYVFMQQGIFPKPRKLGLRRVAWVQSEIEAWIKSRKVA